MNKILALILLLVPCLALGTPVPLNNIPGVNLTGVSLEMTKAELLATRPQAISVSASGNSEQLAERVPNGPTYWYEFRGGKLIHVLAAPARMSAVQQAQQTQTTLQALTTRFGTPAKISLGRQRRGAGHQVVGAQFDLGGEYSGTKALLESNELEMRVSIFKTDVEPAVQITIPVAQMPSPAPGATPAPAIRDFLNELLP